MAFNVPAALATGGLGVSGLEPACGLPYPTPGPPVCRGAAEELPGTWARLAAVHPSYSSTESVCVGFVYVISPFRALVQSGGEPRPFHRCPTLPVAGRP